MPVSARRHNQQMATSAPSCLPPDAQASLADAAAALDSGAMAQAYATLQALVAAHPSDPAVLRLLGSLCRRMRDTPAAITHLSKASAVDPQSPLIALELGQAFAAHGDLANAMRHFEKAAALDPQLFEASLLLGVALLRNAQPAAAIAPLRNARRLQPGHPDALRMLADAEFQAGSPSDALPLWQAVTRARPQDPDARMKLGETLSRLGQHEQAVACFQEALQVMPESADLWMAIAQAHEDAGDRTAASQAYARAAERRPGWAQPLAGMLGLARGKASLELIAQARSLLGNPAQADADRALLGYALGKVQDSLGHYDDAMASWRQANAARRRMTGAYQPEAVEQHVQRLMAVFDADFFARHRPSGSGDERPLFVVGMPRSGTTLTEQILASHSQAFGCGELPDIALILKAVGPGWPQVADRLDQGLLQRHASAYLQAASRLAPADCLRLVDKAPLNYYNLGLIALLFPKARIVWCRRDPRDIALSIFSENFSFDSQFSTDLADIGHSIRLQTRLMRHWQSVLPLPVLELEYEKLVQSPEVQARRLVDFAGLAWEPGCLEFHRSQRGVQTPSRWQVREPIHARSVGRWRNYGQSMDAVLAE